MSKFVEIKITATHRFEVLTGNYPTEFFVDGELDLEMVREFELEAAKDEPEAFLACVAEEELQVRAKIVDVPTPGQHPIGDVRCQTASDSYDGQE